MTSSVSNSKRRKIKQLFRRDKNKNKNKNKNRSKRFFEGWYYRVTLPEEGDSFVFIFSIEDPGQDPKSKLALAACQVMGPNDEYIVQADADDSKFWAWRDQQGLGCTFEWRDGDDLEKSTTCDDTHVAALNPKVWSDHVVTGFQMLPTSLQGKITGHDGSLGGVLDGQGIPADCSWDISIAPRSGWGDADQQRSTAGWLASFPVFEPHWQVTMADARASGTIQWKGKVYNFEDQPFYAEKNWGGAFPLSWYWAQCNAFDGYPNLAFTAGGGVRQIPLGKTEELGMIGIHYNGTFYEAVPWTGDFEWEVTPWGRWEFRGRCTSGKNKRLFEAELIAVCEDNVPGVDLRAPTQKDGLAYFCRDSLLADVELSLWEVQWDEELKDFVKGPCIIDQARSRQGGVEVGGDLWMQNGDLKRGGGGWKASSRMKQPMKAMVKFPYLFEVLKDGVIGLIRR